jgi:hypothetical protein
MNTGRHNHANKTIRIIILKMNGKLVKAVIKLAYRVQF